jgi:hypothetical protein
MWNKGGRLTTENTEATKINLGEVQVAWPEANAINATTSSAKSYLFLDFPLDISSQSRYTLKSWLLKTSRGERRKLGRGRIQFPKISSHFPAISL